MLPNKRYPTSSKLMHQMYRKYVPNIMDDSLSLYEQMIAVIEHINNLVRTSDSLSDEITKDMNELITEVNNIRDFSLPENVITVLQEWHESGYLNIIINENLQTQMDDYRSTVDQQLLQTAKKIKTDYVNVAEFGAIADYYLADGTVNPNPTDNYNAITNALAVSGKITFSESGGYYCSQPLLLPKHVQIEGNFCTLFFDGDGLNLGSHIWNRPKIFNLYIYNTNPIANQNKTGKAFFSDNTSIVYPEFGNMSIRGFHTGMSFICPTFEPNLTWGKIGKIKIEYCTNPILFKDGWANTVDIDELILNFNTNSLKFEDCKQIHRFTIKKLVLETNGNLNNTNMSPVHFLNCSNGEVTIKDLYVEHNGKMRAATAQEKIDYTTTGTKVAPFPLGGDTKSWLLGNNVYSEDTGQITSYDLGNNATFKFEDCHRTLRVKISGMYTYTNLLGLASFINSPIDIAFEDINLFTDGFSFPNMRKVLTLVGTMPTVRMKNMTNTGGGALFNYDGIDIIGDKFSLPFVNREKEFAMTDYLPLPPLSTVDLQFNTSVGNDRFVLVDTVDKTKLLIGESGYYAFTYALRFGASADDNIVATIFQSDKNQMRTYFTNVKIGNTYNGSTMMALKKGDVVYVRIQNTGEVNNGVAGSTTGVNWLNIRKLV